MKYFVILDTETTGLDNAHACSIAYLICALKDGQLIPTHDYQEFFNPLKAIEPKASEINGLTNEMLAHARPITEFSLPFTAHDEVIICGHNVAFDVSTLKNTANSHLTAILETAGLVCTCELARSLLNSPKNNLSYLAKHYLNYSDDELNKAHTAYFDCQMVLDLLNHLLENHLITPAELGF